MYFSSVHMYVSSIHYVKQSLEKCHPELKTIVLKSPIPFRKVSVTATNVVDPGHELLSCYDSNRNLMLQFGRNLKLIKTESKYVS